MKDLILLTHAKGAPGLRLLGIGHGFRPLKGVSQLFPVRTASCMRVYQILDHLIDIIFYTNRY